MKDRLTDKHILLVDLYSGGHHPRYLEHLVRYCAKESVPGRLTVAVTTEFGKKHPEIRELVDESSSSDLEYIEISPGLDARLEKASLLGKDRIHGEVISDLVSTIRPDFCFLMYMDHAQLSLGGTLRKCRDCSFGGIYFRPSMHYGPSASRSRIVDAIRKFRKIMVLKFAGRNKQLKLILSLDPFAVPHIDKLVGGRIVRHVPDPTVLCESTVEKNPEPASETVRLVLPGVIDERKGVFQVLEALRLINDPVELTIMGPVQDHIRDKLMASIETVRRDTQSEIIVIDRYVSEKELCTAMNRSDAVLLTYLDHIGSSNLLIKAASIPKPVIATDYGLVGRLVQNRKLGITTNAHSPSLISSAVTRFMRSMCEFDEMAAKDFAKSNTTIAFTKTVMQCIESTRFVD